MGSGCAALNTVEYYRMCKEHLNPGGVMSLWIPIEYGNAEIDLLAQYAGRAADLGEWMEDAQINRDRNLRLQYLAGMSVNSFVATDILQGILKFKD